MKCKDPARETALCLLCDLEAGRNALDYLPARLDALAPRDRRFARQLVLGTLRWRRRIDWIVDQSSRRSIASCSSRARQILRMGVYQIGWLDRVPARAAVHTSVELAKEFAHRGVAALVNAVLRRVARRMDQVSYPSPQADQATYLGVYHSHPQWLVDRWLRRWGGEVTADLLRSNNARAAVCIRLNRLRASAGELQSSLGDEGFRLEPAGLLPEFFAVPEATDLFKSRAYETGLFQVQDANAGLPVALLGPRPGERVLDLCSAPGGKTTQIAAAMGDQGLVVAADRSHRRLLRVRENARRLGLKSIWSIVQDARTRGGEGFDRVLADVPCSGSGILGRHPDARWGRRASDLPALVEVQEAIIAAAFARLKPGGIMVYSTCSLEEEENAGVVERFLAATRSAELEPAAAHLGPGPWAGVYLETRPDRERGDGSFAARIRKRST